MKATKVIETLEKENRNSAMHLGNGERELIQFTCHYLAGVGYEHTLVRHVVYFLSHCGSHLSQTAIALVTQRTDRNVRQIAGMDTEEFRKSVTFSPKESAGRPPKIPPRLIPIITEYLLTHQVTSKRQILGFLKEKHGFSLCWDTLNAVLRQYNLERLIQRRVYQDEPAEEATPLFSAVPASRARG